MQIEILKLNDRFNEYLMVGFRTAKGVSTKYIEEEFGSEVLSKFEEQAIAYQEKKWIVLQDGFYKTTNNGKLMADKIAAELFITENFE